MPQQNRITWPDSLLAALFVIFSFGGTHGAAANQGATASAGALTIAVLAALPLAAWRWRPQWTFVLIGTLMAIYLALGYPFGPIMISGLLAVFALVSRTPVHRGLIWVGGFWAVNMLAVAIRLATNDGFGLDQFATVSGWVIVPTAIGIAVYVRREASGRVREEQSRRAVTEERLRMAQEIHDTVGHGLAVIAMQSGVALHVLEREPAKVREALEAIRDTSKASLDELRAELDALRGEPAPQRPSNGLADVPALAHRVRSGGVPLRLDLGDVDGLPQDIDAIAYRIIQESLTNVLRHGGPSASASVAVKRADDALTLQISNTVTPGAQPSPGSGQGIVGMQQRVAAVGGTLSAGPTSGGFKVEARIPL